LEPTWKLILPVVAVIRDSVVPKPESTFLPPKVVRQAMRVIS
jgi:hypothetical protein